VARGIINRSQKSLNLLRLIPVVSLAAGLFPVETCQNNSIADKLAREGFFASLSKAR